MSSLGSGSDDPNSSASSDEDRANRHRPGANSQPHHTTESPTDLGGTSSQQTNFDLHHHARNEDTTSSDDDKIIRKPMAKPLAKPLAHAIDLSDGTSSDDTKLDPLEDCASTPGTKITLESSDGTSSDDAKRILRNDGSSSDGTKLILLDESSSSDDIKAIHHSHTASSSDDAKLLHQYGNSSSEESNAPISPSILKDKAYYGSMRQTRKQQQHMVIPFGSPSRSHEFMAQFQPSGIATCEQITMRAQKRFHFERARILNSPESAIKREPKRDWSFGPITGHRVISLLLISVLIFDEYWLQNWLWPDKVFATGFRRIFAQGSVIWLVTLVPGILGLIGVILYRHNEKLDDVKPIPNLVIWRIVSRGTNRDALVSTVNRVRAEMAQTPLFPYVVEVVTDTPPLLPTSDDLICLTVPTNYETPNRSKFKARALHYALVYSPLPTNAWLVHLDEETQPTSSGIKGICDMIAEEERSGQLRIGQGALLYHRSWKEYPFLTLADSMRTGDDFARFYLQHRIGLTLFGLHGSYIVCRNDVEQSVGFDFGPVGSITEDAFWALCCMQNGKRSRWVDGYLEEQSTQSVMDFVKQRRRWYHGLILVSLYAPVRLEYRLSLLIFTVLWTFAPMGMIYTVLNLFLGCSTNEVIRALANFSLSVYATLYLLGVEANLKEHGIKGIIERIIWYALQIVLLPLFSLIESSAVFYALLKPETGFHVVQK